MALATEVAQNASTPPFSSHLWSALHRNSNPFTLPAQDGNPMLNNGMALLTIAPGYVRLEEPDALPQ